MDELEQTIVLVKAWPQASQKYGETVCCAGVTTTGEWRRLYPIRFRHLDGDAKFDRWDVITYRPHSPSDDNRRESRRIDEATLRKVRSMPKAERAGFFDPLFRRSIAEAAELGESLTLVRPDGLRFKWRRRSQQEQAVDAARRAEAQVQTSLFDPELSKLELCPYDLRVAFDDAAGAHDMACSDWESSAAFFNLRRRLGEKGALNHLRATYEEAYAVAGGVALALGTVKKRPQQWLMLGVLRLDETVQQRLL
ncbi:MAG TPA: hypothetical protein VGS12_04005 [Caulobacteraceae bacterium]|nr:hypothetical protein [Caulobacteraceae bacterium]